MARIIYAWELGGDYGHIGSFMPLAQELRNRGHEVIFVIRDLTNAETVVSKHRFQILQAPIWAANIRGLPVPPLNYSEIILRYGFINKNALSALNRAWLGLFGLLRPAVVIADHSPVALFSARAVGIPRVVYGTGFCSPPHTDPMPNMRPWSKPPQKRLEEADRHVIAVCNSLLKDMRSKALPLETVSDLFKVDEDFLCTFPHMDHYPQRQHSRYWGPVSNIEDGIEVEWPAPAGKKSKRIFAYLKMQHRDYEKVIKALQASGHSVLVFSPGLSLNMVKKYQGASLTIVTDPIKLAPILEQCDLGICHAGHGTMAALLMAKVPLLLLPLQLEQYLASARVQQYGAAEIISLEKDKEPDYLAIITRMLTTDSYRLKAAEFAETYAGFDRGAQFRLMADRIDEIVALTPDGKKSQGAGTSHGL